MGDQHQVSLPLVKGQDVYSVIWHWISTGHYVPGQRLSERELAQEFKVSRTPVRESLRHLIQEGLVIYKPHRGYQIITISEDRARNLMLIREALETLAARLASQCSSKKRIRALQKTIEKAQKAYERGQLSGLINANQEFHSLLVEASGNPFLISFYHTIQAHIGLMMSVSLSWPRRPEKTLKEHQEIIDALKSGNPSKAENAARAHIHRALKGVLRNVKSYLKR